MSLFMSRKDCEHRIRRALTRRDILVRAAHGFGSIALASLLEPPASAARRINPLAAKPPNFPAKAKSVIFLFMAGGPSHLETFDPKPMLNKLDGQARPAEFGEEKYQFIQGAANLRGTKRTVKKYGKNAIEGSD